MSYSFGYTTPPVLQATDLGYLCPYLGTGGGTFTNKTSTIYQNVIPGVYNITFSCSVSTYPGPVTVPLPDNPIYWEFTLYAGSTQIITNIFLASPTTLFYGGGGVSKYNMGSSVILCTTFINTTTQDISLHYISSQLGIGSQNSALSLGNCSLCRIA